MEKDRIRLIVEGDSNSPEFRELIGKLTPIFNHGLELPTRYPKPSSINLTGQQLEVWQLVREETERYNCADIGKRLLDSHSDWDKKKANGVASRALSKLFLRYGLIEYTGKIAVVKKGRLLSHYRTINDTDKN